MRPCVVAVLLLGLGLASGAVDAHPHVFVDYAVVLVLGPDGTASAQMTWRFDDMSSDILLADLGIKRGPTSTDVTARALTQFPDLRGERFFLELRVDGALIPVTAVRDFQAHVEHDRLRYDFTVPIALRNPREGTIEIRVDDVSYFVAFEPSQVAPPAVRAPAAFAGTCRVVPGEGSYEAPLIRCLYRRRAP